MADKTDKWSHAFLEDDEKEKKWASDLIEESLGPEELTEWERSYPMGYALKETGKQLGQMGLETAGAIGGGLVGSLTGIPGATFAGSGVGYATGKRAGEHLGLSEKEPSYEVEDIGFDLLTGMVYETGARVLPYATKGVGKLAKKVSPKLGTVLFDVPISSPGYMWSEAERIVQDRIKMPELSWREYLAGKQLEKDFLIDDPLKSIVEANVREAGEIIQAIPGTEFSLGSETGLGTVISSEKALMARSKKAIQAKEAQFYKTNQAIKKAIDNIDTKQKSVEDVLSALRNKKAVLTQAEKDREIILNQTVEKLNAERERLIDEAIRQAESHAERLSQLPTKEEFGGSSRKGAIKIRKEHTAKSEELYVRFPQDILMEDTGPLINRAQEVLDPHTIGVLYDSADKTARSILNKLLKKAEITSDLTESQPLFSQVAIKKRPQSFIGWLRKEGGIWDEQLKGEMAEFTTREGGAVSLVNKQGGKPFDELAARAVEDGWLPRGSTGDELRHLLRNEISGLKAGSPKNVRMGEEPGLPIDERVGEIVAADLRVGDMAIIDNKKYVHKGYDKDGNIILEASTGEKRIVDPFDKIEVGQVKYAKKQGEVEGSLEQLPITSGELRELDKFLNKTQRRLQTQNVPGSYELSWRFGKLKEGITETYEAYARQTGDKELQKTINTATKFTREIFAPLWRSESPSRKILTRDYSGKYRISEPEIGGKFFLAGERGVEIVRNYRSVYQDMSGLKNYAGADLLDAAYLEGEWNTPAAVRWLRSYKYALKEMGAYDEFQEIIADVSKVGAIRKSLPKVDPKGLRESFDLAEAKLRKESFEKGAANKIVEGDAEKAIENALKGNLGNVRSSIRQIKDDMSNNQDAVNGLRRAFLNYIQKAWRSYVDKDISKSTTAVLSKVERLFETLKPGMEELFTSAELNTLEQSRKAIYLTVLQNKNVIRASETAMFLEQHGLRDIRRVISLAAGMAGHPSRVPEWILSKISRVKSYMIDDVLVKAHFDPDYGRMILKVMEDQRKGIPIDTMARNLYKAMLIAGTTYYPLKTQAEPSSLNITTSSGSRITQ